MILDVNLNMRSLPAHDSVIVTNQLSIYSLELVGRPFLLPWYLEIVDDSWRNKISLCSCVYQGVYRLSCNLNLNYKVVVDVANRST